MRPLAAHRPLRCQLRLLSIALAIFLFTPVADAADTANDATVRELRTLALKTMEREMTKDSSGWDPQVRTHGEVLCVDTQAAGGTRSRLCGYVDKVRIITLAELPAARFHPAPAKGPPPLKVAEIVIMAVVDGKTLPANFCAALPASGVWETEIQSSNNVLREGWNSAVFAANLTDVFEWRSGVRFEDLAKIP